MTANDALEECPANSLYATDKWEQHWHQIGCIVTYSGSTRDIWINYSMLAVNLLWCWLVLYTTTRTTNKGQLACHLLSFIFVACFQIGLCMILYCSGISIVWCALLGWIISKSWQQPIQEVEASNIRLLSEQQQQGQEEEKEEVDDDNDDQGSETVVPQQQSSRLPQQHQRLVEVMLGSLNSGTILYYAVVAPFITTVAHGCAILLGYLLHAMEWKVCNNRSNRTTENEFQPMEDDGTAAE